jgi:predicted site-specific integrase-resolvase
VSSADQREDLERQAGRVAQECGRRGISLDATVTEVGSGLDGSRVRLRELLSDPTVTMIVGRAPDRLVRFGVSASRLVGHRAEHHCAEPAALVSSRSWRVTETSPVETHVRPAECWQRVLPREDS